MFFTCSVRFILYIFPPNFSKFFVTNETQWWLTKSLLITLYDTLLHHIWSYRKIYQANINKKLSYHCLLPRREQCTGCCGRVETHGPVWLWWWHCLWKDSRLASLLDLSTPQTWGTQQLHMVTYTVQITVKTAELYCKYMIATWWIKLYKSNIFKSIY